jgi:long-subunit acyl-CoA synthetase (AMP-forming)/3-oxoacyl-(acyl-carrier-protein) synthase
MTEKSRRTTSRGWTPADRAAIAGGPPIPRTLQGLITGFDAERLEQVALQWQDGGSWREQTYRALFEQVRDLATALRALGLGRGDRVGLLAENRPEWLVGYLAVTSIGAATLNLDVFWSAQELGTVLVTAEPRLVCTSNRFVDKIAASRDRVPALEHIVLFDENPGLLPDPEAGSDERFAGRPFLSFAALARAGARWRAAGAAGLDTVEVAPEDIATIIFLSTGLGVELTHRGILANIEGFLALMGGRACCGRRWLSLLPFHHAWPMVQAFLCPVLTYSRLVLAPSPKLDDVLHTIKAQRIDYLQLVPSVVGRLYEHLGRRAQQDGLFAGLGLPATASLSERFAAVRRDPERRARLDALLDSLGLPAVECIWSAGAHLYLGAATEFKALGIDVLNAYGLTEASPAMSHDTRRWHKLGSAGRVFPNLEVRIDRPDRWGNGEILCRGPHVMRGYFRDPERTRSVIDAEGWLHTGDVGVLDEEGYLYITGRCKNMVVTPGGKNVYPAELEAAITQSPLVAECVVVPRIEGRIEFPYALIRVALPALAAREAAEGRRYGEAELRALMQAELQRTTAGLAHYKLPRDFELTFDPLDVEALRGRPLRLEETQPAGPLLARGSLPADGSPDDAPRTPVPDAAGTTDPALLARAVAGYLCREIARVADLRADQVDLGQSFFGYLSSLDIVAIATNVERQAGIKLYPPVLFEHIDVRSLAGYLARVFPAEFVALLGDELPVLAAGADGPSPAPSGPERSSTARTRRAATAEEPVAIVGAAAILPGAPDLAAYWANLEAGADSITEIPADRFDWRAYWGDPLAESNKMNTRWGGFVADLDKFDARFFRIAPKEARGMDPQHRLFLETVWAALEDAGQRPSQLAGRDVGVFAGLATCDYAEVLRAASPEVGIHAYSGVSPSVLANRVSYLLGVHGPSETVDTACSSALVAIHRARLALLRGECELAVAGGVNALITPEFFISFSRAGMLSPDGRCHSFSSAANGYVRGEGVGVVVLKPLGAARADGDHVYAVIRGSAVNHGGRASSFTAPNPTAQARLLVAAYEDAGIPPQSVSYLEAHGTGTPLGDPIEVNGLKQAFRTLYARAGLEAPAAPHCALGSVKTNIGHLEGAAGIAGLLKILLAMQHGRIPRSLHCAEPNPYLELQGSPFELVGETRDWVRPPDGQGGRYPRRAGVSSFGVGGTNAHVVLEQLDAPTSPADDGDAASPQLLVLSAKDEDRLREYAARLAEFLARPGTGTRLVDVAQTLRVGRDEHEQRLALCAADLPSAARALRAYAQGEAGAGLVAGKTGDPADAAEVQAALATGDLDALARLWVRGTPVDWQRLPGADRGRRVSLPTYPFARTRHWVEPPAK